MALGDWLNLIVIIIVLGGGVIQFTHRLKALIRQIELNTQRLNHLSDEIHLVREQLDQLEERIEKHLPR